MSRRVKLFFQKDDESTEHGIIVSNGDTAYWTSSSSNFGEILSVLEGNGWSCDFYSHRFHTVIAPHELLTWSA